MERELWPLLYHHLQSVAERFRQKYVQMQPWVLVATMMWAAIHDRPIRWACQESNWTTTRLRPWKIPSAATMSRRIDRVGTGLFWNALQQELQSLGQTDLVLKLLAFMDGKPLPVGNYSKDPDAKWGHGAGRPANGYKLHAIWSFGPLPDAWEVTPLNVNEKTVARRLLPQTSGSGYLLTDGEYDASDLYDIAHERGYQLISPYRKAKNPGRTPAAAIIAKVRIDCGASTCSIVPSEKNSTACETRSNATSATRLPSAAAWPRSPPGSEASTAFEPGPGPSS